MNKTIELPYEFIDRIVIDELKDTLFSELNRKIDHGDDLDRELIQSIKRVIMHYAPRTEYEPILREAALTQMVRESELLGLYDELSTSTTERKGT